MLGFCDALLAGLARDGGLYLPEAWPQLGRDTIANFAGKPYREVAEAVISPFVDGEIDAATLREGMVLTLQWADGEDKFGQYHLPVFGPVTA